MLKVSGSVRMVRKAGMASSKRSHGMSLTAVILKKPTTMRAGAVTGETNSGSLPPAGSGIGSEPPQPETQGEHKEEPDDHACHAGPPSLGDPGPALYVAGHRTGAHAAAEDSRQRIDKQNALGLRHPALLIE